MTLTHPKNGASAAASDLAVAPIFTRRPASTIS
jgi:hypothetical protein